MLKFSTNEPDKDKQYTPRPGAYGIITDEIGLVAIIKTRTGYFLPGGGIEDKELPDDCLRRECLEELGAEITIIEDFAYGNYFYHSPSIDKDMENIGHFFACKIDKFLDVPTEEHHDLFWVEIEKAIDLLFLDNQREAVKIFKTIW